MVSNYFCSWFPLEVVKVFFSSFCVVVSEPPLSVFLFLECPSFFIVSVQLSYHKLCCRSSNIVDQLEEIQKPLSCGGVHKCITTPQLLIINSRQLRKKKPIKQAQIITIILLVPPVFYYLHLASSTCLFSFATPPPQSLRVLILNNMSFAPLEMIKKLKTKRTSRSEYSQYFLIMRDPTRKNSQLEKACLGLDFDGLTMCIVLRSTFLDEL